MLVIRYSYGKNLMSRFRAEFKINDFGPQNVPLTYFEHNKSFP